MKKLTIKICLFFSPLFLILSCVEFFLREIPNDYSYKKECVEERSGKIKNLILGSSHSYYGINPEFFKEETFNLGHVSQTLDYDYELLMKFKNDFNNLKRIYLPISYFSLWDRLELENESWRCKNYKLYYEINKTKDFRHSSELLSLPFKKNIVRVFSYYLEGKTEVTSSYLGWGLGYLFINQKDLIATGETASLRNTFNIDTPECFKRFNESDELLKKIIHWSDENSIKVILFTPPAYKTYVENLNKKQIDVTIKYSKNLAKKYKNCRYYNFIEDPSFTTKDFYDADHLSDIGAKKFSQKLNDMSLNFEK